MTIPDYMYMFSERLALWQTAVQIWESSTKQTGWTRTVMTGYSRLVCGTF